MRYVFEKLQSPVAEVLLIFASESGVSRQATNIDEKGWFAKENLEPIWECNFPLLVIFFLPIPAPCTKID